VNILIRQLHDFDEYHYESNTKTAFSTTDYRSDYQQGYEQAITDYRTNHSFHHYPDKLIRLGNDIFDDKLSEVEEFISGYKDGQLNIKLTHNK